MNSISESIPIRGRGAQQNIPHRFSEHTLELVLKPDKPEALRPTSVSEIQARSIISRNQSPDVGFNRSVNPYQGCEHGCIYCFARPSHAFHDYSPGLDFETRIIAKVNAAKLLARELALPGYRCEPLAVGVNTDAYQPAERSLKITRSLLETCLEFRQPIQLITKSSLVLRDLDLLRQLAERRLVRVSVSVTTLDDELKRILEPRTAGPAARLKVIETLADSGIPVGAMVAPVIPRINDHEIEAILQAVAERGARSASYVLLRLPHEVEPLFHDWLRTHYPERSAAVMNIVRSCHRGQAYRSEFYTRMRGEGAYAAMLEQRFVSARRKLRLDRSGPNLNTAEFRIAGNAQLSLF